MQEVYQDGEWRADRTGTGVSSLFGKQVVYDLKDGFPLLTTKKIHWRSVVHERWVTCICTGITSMLISYRKTARFCRRRL
jgi:thymidylate synthase